MGELMNWSGCPVNSDCAPCLPRKNGESRDRFFPWRDWAFPFQPREPVKFAGITGGLFTREGEGVDAQRQVAQEVALPQLIELMQLRQRHDMNMSNQPFLA